MSMWLLSGPKKVQSLYSGLHCIQRSYGGQSMTDNYSPTNSVQYNINYVSTQLKSVLQDIGFSHFSIYRRSWKRETILNLKRFVICRLACKYVMSQLNSNNSQEQSRNMTARKPPSRELFPPSQTYASPAEVPYEVWWPWVVILLSLICCHDACCLAFHSWCSGMVWSPHGL